MFERTVYVKTLHWSVWKSILEWKDEIHLPILPVAPLLRLLTVTVLLMQTPVWKKNPVFSSRPGGQTWWYVDASAFEKFWLSSQ